MEREQKLLIERNKKKCKQCEKVFKTEQEQENHHCAGARCSICSRLFYNKVQYFDHFRYASCRDKVIQCTNCKERYIRYKDFSNHIIHCFQTPQKCLICELMFQNLIAMKTHLILDHLKIKFSDKICPWCDNYITPEHMSYHIIAKHTDSVNPSINQ